MNALTRQIAVSEAAFPNTLPVGRQQQTKSGMQKTKALSC
jgi:hypothetical protein